MYKRQELDDRLLSDHGNPLLAEKESLAKILDAHMEAVNAALDPHEQLEKIIVAGEEWTVDNGLLTPTMKLKRSAIESRYESKVEAWYATRDRVVWD